MRQSLKTLTPSSAGTPKHKTEADPRSLKVKELVLNSLEEMKAVEPVAVEVRKLTNMTDYIVVASGNSRRHLLAIADRVWEDAKKGDYDMLGMEGREGGEWVLIDLNSVVAHVMLPEQREYYRLEDLWQVGADIEAADTEAEDPELSEAKQKE